MLTTPNPIYYPEAGLNTLLGCMDKLTEDRFLNCIISKNYNYTDIDRKRNHVSYLTNLKSATIIQYTIKGRFMSR